MYTGIIIQISEIKFAFTKKDTFMTTTTKCQHDFLTVDASEIVKAILYIILEEIHVLFLPYFGVNGTKSPNF